jgi:hypothetical protein
MNNVPFTHWYHKGNLCTDFSVFLTTAESSHMQKLLLIVIKDVQMGRKCSLCGIDGRDTSI